MGREFYQLLISRPIGCEIYQTLLFYLNNHYHVINSLPAFFKARYYCSKCERVYKYDFDKHACNEICKICKNFNCKKTFIIKCGLL